MNTFITTRNKYAVSKLATSLLALKPRCSTCINQFKRSIYLTYLRYDNSKTPVTPNKLSMSYDHCVSSQKLVSKTIGQLLDDTTELFPDQEAAVFYSDNKRITFAQLQEQVDQTAAGLLGLGLQKGDRVGIWGQNHLEWLITFFAAAKAGVILVNVNPAFRSSELEYAINKVGIKALIMMPVFKTSDYYEILREITPEIEFSQPGRLKADRVPSLKHVVMTEGMPKKGTFSFYELMNLGSGTQQHQINEMRKKIHFDDPVNIQFTSGTTGSPKGATLTHHNLVNNALAVVDGMGYTQSARICIPVPLYHCFGLSIGCLAATACGATQFFPSKGFHAGSVLETIHLEKCTSVYGTPAMFIDLLNHKNFDQYDFHSLRTGVMAGSPCPIEVMDQIINKMNCHDMRIAYGLTETSPTANLIPSGSSIEQRTSTVGKIIPHTEIKIIDESGQIVPVNTSGEVCYRGHNIFQGYWDDEVRTKDAIDENGWFHTGDLASLDEDGFTRIVGRLKDMVIRGGENIYPTEIENFLYKHPKIEDVQVVGVPDKRMGEELCAWIRLKRNMEASEDEIKEFCKGKISHFKIPRYIEFVKEYPMTITGKIKKFEIRNEMIKRFHDNQQS